MTALDNYNAAEVRDENEAQQKPRYRLEPLNYGELVDRTIRIFRENYNYILPTTFAIYIPYICSTIILFIIRITLHPSAHTLNSLNNLNNMISSLCTFVLIARVTTMVTEIYHGNPVDANTIKIKSSGAYWQIFKTGLFYGLYLVLFIIPIMLVSGLAIFFARDSIIGLIFAIIAIPLMIFFYFKWSFSRSLSVYLVTLEGISGNDALNRSKQLFYSNNESMFKVIFIPLIIQVLLFMLFIAPAIMVGILAAMNPQIMKDSTNYLIFVDLLVIILSIFLNALPIIAMSVVYYDIRIRTEGFDIEREMDNRERMNDPVYPASEQNL